MISVIIRNRNEAAYLHSVLEALSQQDVPAEIVLVDNRSTDESRRIAERYGARIVDLDDFSYGRALNVGFAAATHEICVILSAHSLPLGRSFLAECAKPFDDPAVAAARCVYAGKSADALRWLAPERLEASDDFISKGVLASGCVVRRSVWQRIGFDETLEAAEDKLWSREVLRAGYVIVSPIPAFYLYLKQIPPPDNLVKNYREIKEIFRQTGQLVGFVRQSFPAMLKNLFLTPLGAALAAARTEWRRLALKRRFPH